MTISKPARESKTTTSKKETPEKEKKAKEVINRGGSSPKKVPTKTPSKKKPGRPKKEAKDLFSEKFELKSIQLRLYASKLNEIDNIIKQFQLKEVLPPTYSRHTWFEEAVNEKIRKDTKTLESK